MRTLLILRHGKAAQDDAGPDRDRPLTKRGKSDAEAMGQLLKKDHLVPDCIISSSALRARDTARRAASACKFEGTVTELDELYLAGPEAYIIALQRLAKASERALLVGHNPGLEALALLLTREPTSLPTAGLIVCSLPIANFSEVSLTVVGELSRFERPKDLPE
jgi:phosphohistidine phosphatase